MCLWITGINAQSKLTVAQYTYVMGRQSTYLSPIIQYQSNSSWYVEARYNYEEKHTASCYAGYSFSGGDKLTYTITPMIGGMAGRLQGGAVALNGTLEYKKIYFSTQTQYCRSLQDQQESFFFSWSEAGYHVRKWLDAGLSLQQTAYHHGTKGSEPGVFASYSFRQWSLPVYCFVPARGAAFFVIGITREWKSTRKGHGNSTKPVPPRKAGAIIY